MIYDYIGRLQEYAKEDPCLLEILKFINEHNLDRLADGRYELAHGVYCNVGTYNVRDNGKYEAHKKYADLQLSIAGGEKIEVAFIEHVTGDEGYSVETDCGFFNGTSISASVSLLPGYFVLLYPQDAHMPTLRLEAPVSRKAVFKIPV